MTTGDVTLTNLGVFKVNQTSLSGAIITSGINLGLNEASGAELFLIPVGNGQGIQAIKKVVEGW